MGRNRKKISNQVLKGEKGTNLIERVVLEMGFIWRPTAKLDSGIDGHIEIRDSETEEATGILIGVQSKCGQSYFKNESCDSFSYYCDDGDLKYWLDSNVPVILVILRIQPSEAYWVSIKDYFRDIGTRKTKAIHFNKKETKFDFTARDKMLELAVPHSLYINPIPRQERLYSNLLQVKSFPQEIFVGETEYRDTKSLWNYINSTGIKCGGEWTLKDKKILSFYDLHEEPWASICDLGTVENFGSDEWALADGETKNEFVQLLNRCLKEKCFHLGIRFFSDLNYFYFIPGYEMTERKYKYFSGKRAAWRTVVSRHGKEGSEFFRHAAFDGRFKRYEDIWYLEITPTYHFTKDGRIPLRGYEPLLKGIKCLEKNLAVLAQIKLWAWILTSSPSIFASRSSLLNFGELSKFDAPCGIDDSQWLTNEEEDYRRELQKDLYQKELALDL